MGDAHLAELTLHLLNHLLDTPEVVAPELVLLDALGDQLKPRPVQPRVLLEHLVSRSDVLLHLEGKRGRRRQHEHVVALRQLQHPVLDHHLILLLEPAPGQGAAGQGRAWLEGRGHVDVGQALLEVLGDVGGDVFALLDAPLYAGLDGRGHLGEEGESSALHLLEVLLAEGGREVHLRRFLVQLEGGKQAYHSISRSTKQRWG
mmetsp:Transcript_13422/g.32043  ORF Transcript_13422/g.32043 Transcript_13422/m.32043 type:complete len:203 (+) Transcript_13422:273-881(+)